MPVVKVKIFGWSQGCLQRIMIQTSYYTEFEVRAVSYRPIFFFHERKRGSLAYSSDRQNEVSDIFIISLRLIRCTGKETS